MSVPTLALVVLVWTAAAPALLGACLLLGLRLPERLVERVAIVHSAGLFVLTTALVIARLASTPGTEVHLPPLLVVHEYEWRIVLLVDRLSVTYLALVAIVYPVIVRFSLPFFHREPGAQRYWFLVTLFACALAAVSLSGNVDLLYLGWELVGVTSVLLISFFRRNVRSAQNSLRALVYYRLCDVGLLGAIVWMHHAFPSADFSHFVDDARVPSAALVGFALLFASLGKAAQLPMSPWLHRAMEGPAASSAIFYGALSVHLGPLLLLRTSPLWMPHPSVRVAAIVIGVLTAAFASVVGRTRVDAKTGLAYATMTQLGLLYVEIGLGWHTLALVHLFAHAGLRTWQFLRSSSLIQDFQENPMVGADVRRRHRSGWELVLPARVQRPLYLAASRLFWLDGLQWAFVARPFLAVFAAIERLEDLVLGTETGTAGRDARWSR